MSEYNPNDLTSTLIHIRESFGTEPFLKQGKVVALVSDLAPKLKNERTMLERMSRLGILEEFASQIKPDEVVQKRLIAKSMSLLTHSEYIRSTIAASYIKILTAVFSWSVDVDIPRESQLQ